MPQSDNEHLNKCRLSALSACGKAYCLLLTLLSISFISLLMTEKPASAQKVERWDQTVKMVKVTCKDFYRRPVLNVRNDSLNDVAFSDMMRHRGVNMGPMIIINYRMMANLTEASRKFFVTHECGHHALGHLYFPRPGKKAEQEADCYALRTLIRNGSFTFKHIKSVQEDMRKFGRKTVYHPSGEMRARALMGCIEN